MVEIANVFNEGKRVEKGERTRKKIYTKKKIEK